MLIEDKVYDLTLDLSRQGFKVKEPNLNYDKLNTYTKLIEKWTKVHDLVSQKTFDDIFDHQILDCLAAFMLLEINKDNYPELYIDIGTGAGLPGMVWHLSMAEEVKTRLYEPREKRFSFLKEVRKELNLENVELFNFRMDQKVEIPENTLGSIRALKPEQDVLDVFFNKNPKGTLLWLTTEGAKNDYNQDKISCEEVKYSMRLNETYNRSIKKLRLK